MGFSVDIDKEILNEITTVEDRTEKNKRLALDKYFAPFFSVLLPELGRPEYVIKCVDHLIKYCDMPIEIIVHDDGSGKAKQQKLFNELHDNVSVLIFNTGHNLGLAGAMNRCRKIASSKYLLALNVDCYVTSGFLKNMKVALDLPYTGIVNVRPGVDKEKGSPGVHIASDGTSVSLTRNYGTSLLFGVRAELWDKVGGWDELVQTTASDVGFMGHVSGNGNFNMSVQGTYLNEQYKSKKSEDGGLINSDITNEDYISSARFARGDNNAPKFPNCDYDIHSAICHKRHEDIWYGVNTDAQAYAAKGKIFPSWYTSNFGGQEMHKLFPKDKMVDWEFAKKYGHDKWKDMIIKDFNLE